MTRCTRSSWPVNRRYFPPAWISTPFIRVNCPSSRRGFGGLIHAQIAKVIIAAVDGIAYGGGFELALACDLIVAGQGARFSFPETGLGLVAAQGGCARLPARVSPYAALDWLLTGRIVDAQEALSHGAISRISEGTARKKHCASPNRSPEKILPPAKRLRPSCARGWHGRKPLIRFSTRPGRAPASGCRPPIIPLPVRLNRHFRFSATAHFTQPASRRWATLPVALMR